MHLLDEKLHSNSSKINWVYSDFLFSWLAAPHYGGQKHKWCFIKHLLCGRHLCLLCTFYKLIWMLRNGKSDEYFAGSSHYLLIHHLCQLILILKNKARLFVCLFVCFCENEVKNTYLCYQVVHSIYRTGIFCLGYSDPKGFCFSCWSSPSELSNRQVAHTPFLHTQFKAFLNWVHLNVNFIEFRLL